MLRKTSKQTRLTVGDSRVLVSIPYMTSKILERSVFICNFLVIIVTCYKGFSNTGSSDKDVIVYMALGMLLLYFLVLSTVFFHSNIKGSREMNLLFKFLSSIPISLLIYFSFNPLIKLLSNLSEAQLDFYDIGIFTGLAFWTIATIINLILIPKIDA